MSFPAVVETLMAAGFEGYMMDFRQARANYYLQDGTGIALPLPEGAAVAPGFDAGAVQAAIREAQQQVPGYSYRGFCARIRQAGCAGYMVSFPGRRALYFGRTAETLVEPFP